MCLLVFKDTETEIAVFILLYAYLFEFKGLAKASSFRFNNGGVAENGWNSQTKIKEFFRVHQTLVFGYLEVLTRLSR